MSKKKSAGGDDFLKRVVKIVLISAGAYLVWCWLAVNLLHWEVPPGTDLAAAACLPAELLGMSLIQVSKNFRKKSDAETALKAVQKENAALKKQLKKAAEALGGEQLKIGEST